MAGAATKKRGREDAPRHRNARPSKKIRKQKAYHSDSDDDEAAPEQDFKAVNLEDSDDDIHNAQVDDGEASDFGDDSDDSATEMVESLKPTKKTVTGRNKAAKASKVARRGGASDSEDGGADSDAAESSADEDDDFLSDGGSNAGSSAPRSKSKRNDPAAFATSMGKILGTKLTTSQRSDPLLARSAEAREAGRLAVDAALESKARRKVREQKRLAMEKGRVKDVLIATGATVAGEEGGEQAKSGEELTTAQILETERRLRKVAQRGVVKLFNAVRAAQVKASEAERTAKSEGVLGMGRREEKITEMSRKGFLDLIAAGGGKLKAGGIEEA